MAAFQTVLQLLSLEELEEGLYPEIQASRTLSFSLTASPCNPGQALSHLVPPVFL